MRTFWGRTLAIGIAWIVVVSIVSLSLRINFGIEMLIMVAGGFLIGWEGGRAAVLHDRRRREDSRANGE